MIVHYKVRVLMPRVVFITSLVICIQCKDNVSHPGDQVGLGVEPLKKKELSKASMNDVDTELAQKKVVDRVESILEGKKVLVSGIVVRHQKRIEHNVYSDGSSDEYDGSLIKLLHPMDYKEKQIVVLFQDRDGAVWSEVGMSVKFTVPQKLLEEENEIFEHWIVAHPQ